MRRFRDFLLREHTMVFIFCLAVITGPAISVLFAFDLSQHNDCATYLGLANFDFDQSPVRRFRVLIPFAAALLNSLFGNVFDKFAPTYFTGDFGLPFSFFIINTTLMSYFGLLIYRYCRAFGLRPFIALAGVMVMLTSRYTIYFSALPFVDSLFCVIVAMTLLGIKERNTTMLLWAIFLGPFAKEAFIFIAPLIFFFSHISKKKLVLYFILSGILVFGYRYIYELYAPPAGLTGIQADLNHIYHVPQLISALFSFYGFYKMFSTLFVWAFIPLVAFAIVPGYLKKLWRGRDRTILWFMFAVFIQMLLSVSVERMFYVAMPVLCLLVAVSINELINIYPRTEK